MSKSYAEGLAEEIGTLAEFCNVSVAALAKFVGSTHNIYNKYINGGRICVNRLHIMQMEKMRDVMCAGIAKGILPLPKEVNRKKMNSAHVAEILKKLR